jgi:hypothetical protein
LVSFNGGWGLFASGPDAPTYERAARDFVEQGWFGTEIFLVPTWPASYSFFLSILMLAFEELWWVSCIVIQQLLFLTSSWLLSREIRYFTSEFFSATLLACLLFIPTFIYSPSENMYESLLASSLMIFALFCLKYVRTKSLMYLYLSSMCLSFVFFVQTRFLLLLFAPLLYVARKLNLVNRITISIIALLGTILQIHRNSVAENLNSPSNNLGWVLRNGGFDTKICTPRESDLDLLWCFFVYSVQNPIETLASFINQMISLLGPVSGLRQEDSTWFHGFILSRLLGTVGLGANWIAVIEVILTVLFNFVWLAGAFFCYRIVDKPRFVIMSAPVISTILVQGFTDGDSRYRIPMLPFQLYFWLFGVLELRGWFHSKSIQDTRQNST